MDAKDLMIGDWVLCPDNMQRQVRYLQVRPSVIGIGGSSYDEDEIQPIPLTPEILKKNFPSTTNWYFIGTDKFCFRIDKYKDKWDLYFGRDGKGTNLQIKISYVHELQHALKLCGINKEIEI